MPGFVRIKRQRCIFNLNGTKDRANLYYFHKETKK